MQGPPLRTSRLYQSLLGQENVTNADPNHTDLKTLTVLAKETRAASLLYAAKFGNDQVGCKSIHEQKKTKKPTIPNSIPN
jgi:hypothetical protein